MEFNTFAGSNSSAEADYYCTYSSSLTSSVTSFTTEATSQDLIWLNEANESSCNESFEDLWYVNESTCNESLEEQVVPTVLTNECIISDYEYGETMRPDGSQVDYSCNEANESLTMPATSQRHSESSSQQFTQICLNGPPCCPKLCLRHMSFFEMEKTRAKFVSKTIKEQNQFLLDYVSLPRGKSIVTPLCTNALCNLLDISKRRIRRIG